ncbi:MAG: C10 family peptidase [Paludibacteraceae bacterium]|nr:C10 family peptidase [Paludibacteraceae bacterium]
MKRYIYILGAWLCSSALSAALRSPQQAADVAQRFGESLNAGVAPRSASGQANQAVDLAYCGVQPNGDKPAFYVFNYGEQNGYVVVSADDRTYDILCYSTSGKYDNAGVHPALRWWLGHYAKEIAMLDSTTTAPKKISHTATVTPIEPLLGKIAWDQREPYNDYCPIDSLDTTKSLTGCVATATAQIMRYWKYPACGEGVHSYVWRNWLDLEQTRYKDYTLTTDYSLVSFDWDNMPETFGKDYTQQQASAVANLMLACARGSKTLFGGEFVGGSSAWTDDMGYGLQTHLGYVFDKCISRTESIEEYEKVKGVPIAIPITFNVSIEDFTAEVNASLEKRCPVLMGGDTPNQGHEFVCDGRDADGLFHINWGWSGNHNNYCTLSALRPEGDRRSFSYHLDALIGLRPKTTTDDNTPAANQPEIVKYIKNNHLYIAREHIIYNAHGIQIKQ